MKAFKPVIALMVVVSCARAADVQPARSPAGVVRVAVIGGMNETGFWAELSDRFEKQTGIHVDAVATGPKDGIARVFKQGGVDLITMHACDTIINLVADGYAMDPQPWVKNDMIIVGPPEDPAHIKGMADATKAIGEIVDGKCPLIVHSSLGAQEVLRDITEPADISLDTGATTILLEDRQRLVLSVAAKKKAYTMIGRIPFLDGKIPNSGMVVMVSGDPRLRRPFLVAVADPRKFADIHLVEARRLAAFLREPQTQTWISQFGKGKYDGNSLFYPIMSDVQAAAPAGGLTIINPKQHAVSIGAHELASLPSRDVHVKDRSGTVVTYSGPMLHDVIAKAGITFGSDPAHSHQEPFNVVVRAADGYKAMFSISEIDPTLRERPIILAIKREGQPLDTKEGPLRLIVADESRPTRWTRQVRSIESVYPPG